MFIPTRHQGRYGVRIVGVHSRADVQRPVVVLYRELRSQGRLGSLVGLFLGEVGDPVRPGPLLGREAAIDVDRPSDLDLVSKILAERGEKAS